MLSFDHYATVNLAEECAGAARTSDLAQAEHATSTAHGASGAAGAFSNTAPANYTSTQEPKIIASNVDYLTCSITLNLPDGACAYLGELLAANQGEPVESLWCFPSEAEPLIVAFASNGMPYLHNDYLDLRLRAGPGDTRANVTLYSRAFWCLGGAEMAVARLQRWCDELYGEHVTLKPGRLDLCRDLTGWHIPQVSSADLASQVVTRGRKLQAIASDGTSGVVETWRIGSRKAACHARLYNKSAELRHSAKDYYAPTWEYGGYGGADADGDVTRIEYELHTAFWREWRTDDGRAIENVHELLGELNAVWRYLTHEWLRFVCPDSAQTNRARLLTQPTWLLVSSRFDTRAALTGGDRFERRMPQVQQLMAGLGGYLRSLAAITKDGLMWGPQQLGAMAVRAATDLERRKGSSFSALVELRRSRIFAGLAVSS